MSYIVVHGGAGSLNESSEAPVKRALRRACKTAVDAACSSPLDLIARAISVLEDDACLNAGYGSNLTLPGSVECDASIMAGDQAFGGVGAVQGIRNPIALARAILEYSRAADALGRIPPLLLVSQGARDFAQARLDPHILVDPKSLIEPNAEKTWARWSDALKEHASPDAIPPSMQDTVGAVAFQSSGMAAGVSSGGLLLKHPGRVGEAAVYGSGCWAEDAESTEDGVTQRTSVSCSISGAGEYIIRASLASCIGDAVLDALQKDKDIHQTLEEELTRFWDKSIQRIKSRPNAGVVLLTATENNGRRQVRLWCAFTTPCMSIAYAAPGMSKPKALVIRQPPATDNSRRPICITAVAL